MTRLLGILDSLRLEQMRLEVNCQSGAMPLFLLARPGLRKASKSVEHDRNMGGDSVSGRKIVWMVRRGLEAKQRAVDLSLG